MKMCVYVGLHFKSFTYNRVFTYNPLFIGLMYLHKYIYNYVYI